MTTYHDLSIMDVFPEEPDQELELSPQELKEMLDASLGASFESLLHMLQTVEEMDAEMHSLMEQAGITEADLHADSADEASIEEPV